MNLSSASGPRASDFNRKVISFPLLTAWVFPSLVIAMTRDFPVLAYGLITTGDTDLEKYDIIS